MILPSTLLNDLIIPRWPVPDDPYPRALWADQLEHATAQLSRLFNQHYHTTISLITKNNLTNPDYQLHLPTTPVRRINTTLLRQNHPDAYTKTAYLRATDAEHILGRTALYTLCKTADPARTDHLTRINIGDLAKFTKLIKLCAGRIGQLLNKNSLAVECGVSAPTIDSWLSILEACYIIHFLLPDHRNYSKRLVKSPKLYFCDTGLACSLLEIKSPGQLATHYLRGGLFENMVINEFLKRGYNHGVQPDLSFWRDSSGNEIDLLSGTEEKERLAFEIKSGATFSKEYFKGLNYWSGLSGADSTHKTVIYGGDRSMSTSDGKVSAWKDL